MFIFGPRRFSQGHLSLDCFSRDIFFLGRFSRDCCSRGRLILTGSLSPGSLFPGSLLPGLLLSWSTPGVVSAHTQLSGENILNTTFSPRFKPLFSWLHVDKSFLYKQRHHTNYVILQTTSSYKLRHLANYIILQTTSSSKLRHLDADEDISYFNSLNQFSPNWTSYSNKPKESCRNCNVNQRAPNEGSAQAPLGIKRTKRRNWVGG